MKLSIIIPVLNEAHGLEDFLEHLLPLHLQGAQILLIDGGSEDGSPAIAERLGFTLLRSAKGRARQMNAGAATATGDLLLFLHADTQLPENAWPLIRRALADGLHSWGRFDVRIEGTHFMLPIIAALMNLRSRWSGIATGDQAIFVTRAAFENIGGFPEQPLMEEIELSRRLLKLSRPACIKQPVTTSGRRWESHGVWRTIFLMWRLRFAYWRGVSPNKLANNYQ
jgi:rSAM/selenodomain-associated transferase 2